MGQHFVPQAYLRAFEDTSSPDFIWAQSRRKAVPRLVPIKNIAQSRGFYEPATEALLASAIEAPANPILAKLRRGEAPEERDRSCLAVYIATMIRRVPKNRSRARALAQPTLDGVVGRIREEFVQLAAVGELAPKLAERRLEELDKAHIKFTRELPPLVAAQIRDPRPTPQIIQAILSMRWRVLSASAPDYFITSDNPAFFHEAYGVGTEKSELRLPLSPRLALHGCRGLDEPNLISFHEAPRDWVREFNRSVASGASSVVMSHCRADFLGTLLRRKNPYLFRLVWDNT
jgi:hypothetical protein